uniref:Putative glycine rich protein n=1 Tax=Rhipicephalus pulchellus TaxID=72859 RepID=L7LQF8_RHIPC
MGTSMVFPFSIALAAAMISPGANAQSNELSQVSCVRLRIPDVLNIGHCLEDVLNMCGKSGPYVKLALERLARCIMDKIFSRQSLKVILTALRKPIIFAFRTLFPRVSNVVVPVLKALLPKPCSAIQRSNGTCDRQLLPTTPCSSYVNLTFNDPLDIRHCIDVSVLMCSEEGADKDQMVIELMKTVVCAMKKLPAINVRMMLKMLLCRVSAWLIEFLRSRDYKLMVQVAEMLHALGKCQKYYPMNPKAERRLLPEAEFHQPHTGRNLLQ